MEAPDDTSYSVRRSAATSYALTGDPLYLPLAEELARRADLAGEDLVAGALRRVTLPRLTAAANASSPGALLDRLLRGATADCARATTGRKQGLCQSLANRLSAARAHVAANRMEPARNVLAAARDEVARAHDDRILTDAEYALLGGGVALVLGRL